MFLLVYIRTSPIVAFNRILQRVQPEESKLEFAYLKTLHDLHENWLMFGNEYSTTHVKDSTTHVKELN